jgi:acetylornithine deacetylase/succinyl-diaminopimelate desuccinylase-like protein
MPSVAPPITDLTGLLLEIAGTSAPTFSEEARASLIARRWTALGLTVERDAVGNVIARVPGKRKTRVALAAHLDTVFDSSTDLSVRHTAKRLVGAGIGDNAASLTVLTAYAGLIVAYGAPCAVTLVATVGEEGLGDLRGAKHFLNEHAAGLDAFVAVDGYLGLIVNQAVGVRRYRAWFTSEGGHSWGNAGATSSIQALGEAIVELYKIPLPSEPRTTLNVGTVQGGTSVNSIASSAELLLDLRSLDASALETLDLQAQAAMTRAARRVRAQLKVELVGDRPAGVTDNARLLRAATEALEGCGVSARTVASSTDANACVTHGLPGIGFGVYRGGNAHRLDEWVEPDSLSLGVRTLEALVAKL